MNRIMRNFVVALTLLVSVTANYANTNPTFSLAEGKVLVVNLNDWKNSTVKVTIKDFAGEILHSDDFQNGSSKGRKYNLKNLPSGNYTLIIESATKKAIHNLEVLQNSVTMTTFRNELIFKPMVTINDDIIEMNLLSLGKDISVSISDSKDAFFKKSFNNMATVNKRFDISKLPKGEYTFVVAGKDQYDTFAFVK